MPADTLASKIQAQLQQRFPGHAPLAYAYAAVKVDAAWEMALQKVRDRGVELSDLPRETVERMVDWSIRLAFGAHTQQADAQFFQKVASDLAAHAQ